MDESINDEKEMALIAEDLRDLCRINERIAAALETLAGSIDDIDSCFCIKGSVTPTENY